MPVKVQSTPTLPGLSPVSGKAIVARFDAACMSSDGGLLALREIEQRLAIASRLAGWHQLIGDPTYADAILDRLVHNATRVDLTGESLRKKRVARQQSA